MEVVEGLGRFGTSVTVVGDNCVRMRVSGEHVIPDIARWLVERGVSVFALQGRRKSLEEWFVEVMGTDQRPG